MNFKAHLLGLALLTLGYTSIAQKQSNEVRIVGEMRNVMWKGELSGNINLDTIPDKKNLYGIGPVEYLAGEILILDGIAYKSVVISESAMKIEETFNIAAPFFGYQNISEWTEHDLPDSILTMQELELFVEKQTENLRRPFMFKLRGIVEKATIHIVNLPKGSKVSSPAEAHKGQVNYKLQHEESEIIGFFSTDHKAIFTHHDTYLHMHLITADRQKMGHLDDVTFTPGTMRLYLPAE